MPRGRKAVKKKRGIIVSPKGNICINGGGTIVKGKKAGKKAFIKKSDQGLVLPGEQSDFNQD